MPDMSDNRAPPSRASRLEEAAYAAIERVAAKEASATGEDLFADLGESLFWLTALMDETRTGGDGLPPLLAGLRWARNHVAHGAIVSAPVNRNRPFTLRGGSTLRGGDVLRGSGHSWLSPEEIPGGLGKRGADLRPGYRAQVFGPIGHSHSLREGLALARAATP